MRRNKHSQTPLQRTLKEPFQRGVRVKRKKRVMLFKSKRRPLLEQNTKEIMEEILESPNYTSLTDGFVKKPSFCRLTPRKQTQARLTCMSYFDCFSLTVSTIYCFSPTLRLFFARNWVLLFINENANRCAQLSRSSQYRFSFFVFLSDICCKINKLFQHFEYQITKRYFSQREDSKVSRFLQGFLR